MQLIIRDLIYRSPLKQEKEIPDLRRELKAGFKEMKKIDKPKKNKK